MNHQDLQEKIFALYDGELSDPDSREVRAHLEVCPECREGYTRWEVLASVFFKAPQIHPSEPFVRKVMARIEALEEPCGRKRRALVLRRLVPALGVCLIVGLFVWALPSQGPEVSTEALLLANGRDGLPPPEWIFQKEDPRAEDLLAFILEEP